LCFCTEPAEPTFKVSNFVSGIKSDPVHEDLNAVWSGAPVAGVA